MAHKKHKFIPRSRAVRIRELILLGLLFVFALITVYVSSSHSSKFGLLSEPIRQNFPAVVTQFEIGVLEQPAFLSLDVQNGNIEEGEQFVAQVEDPRIPPDPLELNAFNTNTGTAIVLEWVKPASSLELFINIYRAENSGVRTRIAEHVEGTTWIDTSVTAEASYTYEVSIATLADEVWYESSGVLKAVVKAEDTINPLPPTDVVIVPDTLDDGTIVLKVEWTQPENATEVNVYRSSIYGNRGSLLGTVQTTEPGEYIDTSVIPNIQYWYTLVSVDAAQNMSSFDFVLPAPGNKNPFDYTQVTGE
ncbi:MAG: hypothetical protein KIH62_001315 [Candidatus Kerfeldbacteria bacterium]|nr:hypothetical protein [Candidatus Kerfeldbacteria bacterium]